MHAEMSLNSLCADLCSTIGDGTQAGASLKYYGFKVPLRVRRATERGGGWAPGGSPYKNIPPPNHTPQSWYEGCGNGAGRPRLVQTQCWCPRDVGCCALVVSVAYIFSVQFSSPPILYTLFLAETRCVAYFISSPPCPYPRSSKQYTRRLGGSIYLLSL